MALAGAATAPAGNSTRCLVAGPGVPFGGRRARVGESLEGRTVLAGTEYLVYSIDRETYGGLARDSVPEMVGLLG